MSERKHTPIWYVGGDGRTVLQFDQALERGQLIAEVAGYVKSEGHTSLGPQTARLIAAAPDLLEALKEARTTVASMTILDMSKGDVPMHPKMLAMIDAAIAKATQ